MARLTRNTAKYQPVRLPEELILKVLAYVFERSDETWEPMVIQPDFNHLRLTTKQISRLTDTFQYRNLIIHPGRITSLKESVSLLRNPAVAASVRSVHIAYVEQEPELDHLIDLIDISVEDREFLRSAEEDVGIMLDKASNISPLQSWVTAVLFRLPRLTALKLPPSSMQTGKLTTYHPLEFYQRHPERLPYLRKLSLATSRGVMDTVLSSLVQITSLRKLEIEGWLARADDATGNQQEFSSKSSLIENLTLLPSRSTMLTSFVLQESIISCFTALRSITINTPDFPPKAIVDALFESLQVHRQSLERIHIFSADEKIHSLFIRVVFREFENLRTLSVPPALIFGGSRLHGGLAEILPQSLEHLTIHGSFSEPLPSRIIQLTHTKNFPNLKSVTLLGHSNFIPLVYEEFDCSEIEFTDYCLLEKCHTMKSVPDRVKYHRQIQDRRRGPS